MIKETIQINNLYRFGLDYGLVERLKGLRLFSITIELIANEYRLDLVFEESSTSALERNTLVIRVVYSDSSKISDGIHSLIGKTVNKAAQGSDGLTIQFTDKTYIRL
jgi:hypothetical protein